MLTDEELLSPLPAATSDQELAAPVDAVSDDELLTPVSAGQAPPGQPTMPEAQPEPPPAPRRVNMLAPPDAQGQSAPVNIDPANLDEAYRQGFRLAPTEAPASGMVQLLEQGGVSAYQAPEALARLAKGAQLATPAEVEREYGDVGSQAATGLESAAQGATMGAYGALAGAVAGPEYTAERKLREEANPVTAIAGTLAGAAAPAILSGGAGAVGAAARMTPVGALASLSTRVGAALLPRVAAGAVGALGRVAASAGLGAGEGAIDNGVRRVMDNLAQGKVDHFAEGALDAAWDGAKWGGAFGGGAAALGEGLHFAASKLSKQAEAVLAKADDADAAIEQARVSARLPQDLDADIVSARGALDDAVKSKDSIAADDAAASISQLLDERESVAAANMGFQTHADINAQLQLPPQDTTWLARAEARLNKARNANEATNTLGDELDKTIRPFTDDMDSIQRFRQNEGDTYLNRGRKLLAVQKRMQESGLAWDEQRAVTFMQKFDDQIDELRSAVDGSDAKLYSEQEKRLFKGALNKAEEARELAGKVTVDQLQDTSTLSSLFMVADDYKKELGKIASRNLGSKKLQRAYMDVRAMNQDAGLWGPSVAEMQTNLNAAISREITSSEAMRTVFGRGKGELTEKAGQYGFDLQRDFDPQKLDSLLRDAANPTRYKDEASLIGGIDDMVKRLDVEAQYYPMPDAAKAQLEALKVARGRIVDRFKAIKALSQKKLDAQRLMAEHSPFEDMLTALRSNPWTAPIGVAGTVAVRGVAAPVLALAKGAAKAEAAVDSAARATAKTFFRGVQENAGKFTGGAGIVGNQVQRAIQDAKALQDPASKQSRGLAMQIRAMQQDSPELAQAVESKVREKAEYILSKLGSGTDDSDPFGAREAPMDPITQMRIARYVDAAQHIDKVLGRLASGSATMEDVDALRVLRPNLYNRYVDRVLAEVKSAKVPPTTQQRARLHFLLGVPMSREQQPSFVAAMQQLAVQQPEQPQKQPKPGYRFTFGSRESFGARSDQITSEKYD